MSTETFDEVIEHAEPEGFYGAAVLLRFAAEVFYADTAETSRWVGLRAIDRAEQELRGAVDCGDDMNTVDARMAAIRQRIGISGIRDAVLSAPVTGAAADFVERPLRDAADKCVQLWLASTNDA